MLPSHTVSECVVSRLVCMVRECASVRVCACGEGGGGVSELYQKRKHAAV